MTGRARRKTCAGIALALGVWPIAATAQWSASIAAESDYRLRGVSLSDGRPSLRATLNVDAAGGGYGGAAATSVRVGGDRYTQLLAYGGLVLEHAGRSIDLGASASHFTGDTRYGYAELYAGLPGERWNLRAAYSPHYFGQHLRTLYLEANGHRPLGMQARLFAHAGALLPLGGDGPAHTRRSRADVRAGLGWTLGDTDLQLAWTTTTPGGPYPVSARGRRRAWVLGASLSF